jgi:hypothetical protein
MRMLSTEQAGRDLFQFQVSHTAFAMVLNLLTLHPSHRRAVSYISRRRDTSMARLSSSLGASAVIFTTSVTVAGPA